MNASSTPEQAALTQALDRLIDFTKVPERGASVLDLSAQDVDLSGLFVRRGCNVARLQGEGPLRDGVTPIVGLSNATGLPEHSLDMLVVGGARAMICDRHLLFEGARVLKPQAPLALMYAAPVALPGTVAALTENLALQFNPFWERSADSHAITLHLSHLAMSGFLGGECHSLDTALSFTRETWVDYSSAQPLIVEGGLSPAELQDFRLVLNDYIKRDFGSGAFYVPFRTLTYIAYRGE